MSTATSKQAAAEASIAWQLLESLDEHRGHPRIDLDCDVEFRNGAGQHCVAKLVNLAPNGIQIRCNVAVAQVLHPGCGKICPQNAPIVQVEIPLSLSRGAAVVSVCARLTYLTTLPEEPRCVIGLEFLDPRPTALRILRDFFAEHLQALFEPGRGALSATA